MSNIDPNLLLTLILFFLVVASFTAHYANRQGRNPFLWFILSFILGIFAPLILLLLPVVKNDDENNGMPTMTVSPPDHHPQLPKMPPTPTEIKRQLEENKLWYYLDQSHQQIGPVSVIALRELWNRGQLGLNDYVWTAGMEKWEKVDDLTDLKAILNKE